MNSFLVLVWWLTEKRSQRLKQTNYYAEIKHTSTVCSHLDFECSFSCSELHRLDKFIVHILCIYLVVTVFDLSTSWSVPVWPILSESIESRITVFQTEHALDKLFTRMHDDFMASLSKDSPFSFWTWWRTGTSSHEHSVALTVILTLVHCHIVTVLNLFIVQHCFWAAELQKSYYFFYTFKKFIGHMNWRLVCLSICRKCELPTFFNNDVAFFVSFFVRAITRHYL